MAEGYNYSDWGFVLPQSKVSTDEVMQHLVAQKQQEKVHQQQLNLQEQHRREQQQQQNRLYNLREIDGDTDLKNYQTGEKAFDSYSQNELQRIKDNAIKNYVNLDPAEMEYRLSQDMKDLVQWHTTSKDLIKNVGDQLKEFNKTYPNADAVKAHQFVFDNVAKDLMEQDPNTGQWKRKPVDHIVPKDYVAQLQQPEVLGAITNDTSPFYKHVQGMQASKLSDEDLKNIKGYSSKRKVFAEVTPYSYVSFGKSGIPQIDVKHKVGANGEKLIDDDVLANIEGDPQARAALYAMWNKERQDKESQLGRPLSSDESVNGFKNFAYNRVKQFNKSSAGEQTSTVTPKISVNVRGGGGSQINNTYGRLASSTPNGYVGALKDLDMTVGDNADIMEYAKKNLDQIEQKYVTPESIIVKKDQDGNTTRIFYKNGKNEEVYLGRADFRGLNRVSNKSMGTKTKQQIETESKATDNQQPKPKPTGTPHRGL